MLQATAASGSRSNSYRKEFVVVGWTDPEGRRAYPGALLLAYRDPDGTLVYTGRAGTGINPAELQRLWRRLQPLATDSMPLDVAPPSGSRFGTPLVLSRVHWIRPELVAELPTITCRGRWCEGLREDKPAAEGTTFTALPETTTVLLSSFCVRAFLRRLRLRFRQPF